MKNESYTMQMIDIDQLYPHPQNPRSNLGDLSELVESIKKVGVLQNLTVIPHAAGGYTILGGHRRHAASLKAGIKQLPCVVIPSMDPADQIATMMCENLQRNELMLAEQVRGFQMMIELGDSVADVVAKTGLSESTVRRRIKLAEMDHEKLADACGKNITIEDMLKLNEIESMKERNAVLAKAGTSDFNLAYKNAIDRQNAKKNLPLLIEEVNTFASEVKSINHSKYSYGSWLYARDYKKGAAIKAKSRDKDAKSWVYTLEKNTMCVALYYESSYKTASKEKTPEQKAKEADIRKREKELKRITANHFELRREFVKNGNVTKKLTDATIVDVMTSILVKQTATYWNVTLSTAEEYFGISTMPMSNGMTREARLRNFIGGNRCRIAQLILIALGDDDKNGFWDSSYRDYPTHRRNEKLGLIYGFLETMGYEKSTEENQMYHGTHELFQKDGE